MPNSCNWVVYVSIVPAERHLFQPRPRQSTSKNSDWCDSLPDSPLSEPGPWKKIHIPKNPIYENQIIKVLGKIHAHAQKKQQKTQCLPSWATSHHSNGPTVCFITKVKVRGQRIELQEAARKGWVGPKTVTEMFDDLIGKDGFPVAYIIVVFLQDTQINQQFLVPS